MWTARRYPTTVPELIRKAQWTVNITSQCAVPLSSFEPNTHQAGGCPCYVDPQWTWPFFLFQYCFCQNPDGCPWVNVQQQLRAVLARKRLIFLPFWRIMKEQKTVGLCVKLHLKGSCWLVFAALVIRILVKSLLITLFYQFVLFSLTLFTTTSCFQSHSPVSNSIMMIRPNAYVPPLRSSPLKYVFILTNLTICLFFLQKAFRYLPQ